MKPLKVLLHVNETDRWKVALGNAENLLKSVAEGSADAVILANGQSVLSFEDLKLVAVMKKLSEKGIVFLACRNSMLKMKEEKRISITEEDLPPFVTVVPAGIVALIEKQNEGYAYVKP